jgi:hypothetical protein
VALFGGSCASDLNASDVSDTGFFYRLVIVYLHAQCHSYGLRELKLDSTWT